MKRHADLFSPRQLTALCTFSELVMQARQRVIADGADEPYADAVTTYLGLGVSRLADIQNSLCRWENTKTQVRNLFSRQAIQMVWDFGEAGLFSGAAGDYAVSLNSLCEVLDRLPASGDSDVSQVDATSGTELRSAGLVICTDPPYYDNVGYADLSDFFYVWLRRSIGSLYPPLFRTVLTPKAAELVADPFRTAGNQKAADDAFEAGFERAFRLLASKVDPRVPMAVFYAFKQAEDSAEDGFGSTGWETMLEGLLRAGFAVTGTWPIRTELSNRMRGQESNALASSIVLVCRPRAADAGITDRRGFLAALRAHLPRALRDLQEGSIAPVDLAQAAIGPGMAVFSAYSRVVEPDGSAMRVRTALGLINQALDEVLVEQEGEFDADTRWAVAWFEQSGFQPGRFGDAETLSKAKVTSIDRLAELGIVSSRSGVVRLLHREELDATRGADARDASVWALTQRLIHALESDSEEATARILAEAGGQAEAARDLAYRLFVSAERRGWATDALAFNGLVTAWPELTRLAASQRGPVQETML
jgi:putative DNA methylase